MKKVHIGFALLFTCLLTVAYAAPKQILMVVTSAGAMTNGEPTGLWLEEFALPYQLFSEQGYAITVASPKGGKAPVDERSLQDENQVSTWTNATTALEKTKTLDAVNAADFDALFIPGGHGTMFDFPGNAELQRLLHNFHAQDKIIASVCHGPAAFVGTKTADGTPLVKGKTITAFTDAEEKAVGLDSAVPFLLEKSLRAEGANFVPAELWQPNTQVDGKLVTGQNPASSQGCAEAVIKLLQ